MNAKYWFNRCILFVTMKTSAGCEFCCSNWIYWGWWSIQ